MLKENCYFYTEFQDMGAHIPCCTRYTQIGKCPCDDCDCFLDKADARKIIKKYSDGELIPIDNIKQEIFNTIDNVPITLSRDNADKLLKADIQNIIDKHLKQKTEKKSCDTCKHYMPDNPYCECCFDLDKYERKDK